MPKALCIVGIVVAVLLLLLFGLDLAIGFPFGRQSIIMSVGFVLSSLVLASLSWLTFKEQK
jgi:hypothetical protein